MDINELKIKELMQLMKIFNNKSDDKTNNDPHPYTGKYVIVRAEGSGCHFGMVKSYDPQDKSVFLEKSRRLWKWTGFTLSAVANDGMYDGNAKLAQELPEIMITNVLELIPCTENAIKNISNYPVFVPEYDTD